MSAVDELLYSWICRANIRRDDLDLPIGVIEDGIANLQRALGSDYLEQLLVIQTEPVHVWDDEANPLRKWLFSARVDDHIIQVLELARYLRAFEDDAALQGKIDKLKHDRFWPMFFELAMATRAKRICHPRESVSLSAEVASSIGDFTITGPGYRIACECSRLGRSPQITEPYALQESLTHLISAGTKRLGVAVCVKIHCDEPLTGITFNNVLRLIRSALADARRSKLPTEHKSGSTTVTFEELTDKSEQVPDFVDGKRVSIGNIEWQCGMRLYNVPSKDRNDISERFDQGERFHELESVRLFMKFGEAQGPADPYVRLTAKLKKKIKQTKTSTEHFGKVVFVEVPFDLERADQLKLEEAVRSAAIQSQTTLAVILANRQGNPQFRHHYSQSRTYNKSAAALRPDVLEFFDRLAEAETKIDPILAIPFRRSWTEAQARARTVANGHPLH